MTSLKTFHCLHILLLLPLAFLEVEGILCRANNCHGIMCDMPRCPQGQKPAQSVGCGCCPTCVQTLDEGSACLPEPTKTIYANGSYSRTSFRPPVCKDRLFCTNGVCQAGTCTSGKGHRYVIGQRFTSSDGCNTCTCMQDGNVRCTEMACVPGTCTSGEGHRYATGQTFNSSDGCNTCTCMQDGNVRCTLRACVQETCSHVKQKILDRGQRIGEYLPQCNGDGSYRAKQCGPGPVCHCVNQQNVRIGSYSAQVWEALNMTCLCAREKDQDHTVACTEQGNHYESCAHRKRAAHAKGIIPGQYVPQCKDDGSYKARQCGIGSVCRCVNEQNKQIDQYEVSVGRAANMTCLCAREKDRLQDRTMECTELGNYRDGNLPGTCTSGDGHRYVAGQSFNSSDGCNTCMCMQDGTAACTKIACVPGNCAQARRAVMQGDVMLGQYIPQCKEDGSYRAKQCGDGGWCYCVNEQNVRIGNYSARFRETINMTCLCAREKNRLQDRTIKCTEHGNYRDGNLPGNCAQARRAVMEGDVMAGQYIPQCKEDGSYRAKQCKASGAWCYCVNEHNVRIGNYSAWLRESLNMTCLCARQQELVRDGRVKCTELGNFPDSPLVPHKNDRKNTRKSSRKNGRKNTRKNSRKHGRKNTRKNLRRMHSNRLARPHVRLPPRLLARRPARPQARQTKRMPARRPNRPHVRTHG